MATKLSANTHFKNTIRRVWCSYVEKLLAPLLIGVEETDEPYELDFTILTLIEEQLLDIQIFLKDSHLQIENIIAVSEGTLAINNYYDFLNSQFAISQNEARNKYAFQGRLESVISKINHKIDVYNLDYNGFYHSITNIDAISNINYPLGINEIFTQVSRFNTTVHFFLTNNLDQKTNSEVFNTINTDLKYYINESIIIIPDALQSVYESLLGIILSFTTIALEYGFSVKAIHPFIYSPSNTYWMHMTIFSFEKTSSSAISAYLQTGERKSLLLKENIRLIRSIIPKIQILESEVGV